MEPPITKRPSRPSWRSGCPALRANNVRQRQRKRTLRSSLLQLHMCAYYYSYVIRCQSYCTISSRRNIMTKSLDNQLPAEQRAYFLNAGAGERYVFGTQLATVIAEAKSTGGMF